MKKIISFIKLIAIVSLIALALDVVSNQDIEYQHQRAQLIGYER